MSRRMGERSERRQQQRQKERKADITHLSGIRQHPLPLLLRHLTLLLQRVQIRQLCLISVGRKRRDEEVEERFGFGGGLAHDDTRAGPGGLWCKRRGSG